MSEGQETGSTEPTVTLREHFDWRISEMEKANASEHAVVIGRLVAVETAAGTLSAKLDALDEKLDEKLGNVVTWKSLGGSIAVVGGLVGLVAGLASLLGIG